MIAFSGQRVIPGSKQLPLVKLHKHPILGSQYSSWEQWHRSLHWRPKYPGGQANEQFSPVKPGLHSKRDYICVLI